MGFAAVARVTESRWIACDVKDDIAFGLEPGGELRVESTICHEIRQSGEPVIINHVAEDPTYCGHHTPAMYGFQSYISMPILLPDGSFFGTLCAIDPRPARLNTPEIIGMFKLFAELIAFHLDALDRMSSSEASLADERAGGVLREQFIAVLGHDLRNPLAAIEAGTQILAQAPLDEKSKRVIGLMQNSVRRMSALISDVLDLTRGRLGGGITINRSTAEPLAPALRQVIAELQAGAPTRMIEADLDLLEPVNCDRGRIAQLTSNLLGNALAYGRPGAPIKIHARSDGAELELSVSNTGNPIDAKAMERLFHPFFRGDVQPNKQGLGLGLYICSEIARAHGGRIDVSSTPEETRFVLRVPVALSQPSPRHDGEEMAQTQS
jgi:signal transduction histidine kinase